eukprot:7339675-Pyramimonas_sp.AAC.1
MTISTAIEPPGSEGGGRAGRPCPADEVRRLGGGLAPLEACSYWPRSEICRTVRFFASAD